MSEEPQRDLQSVKVWSSCVRDVGAATRLRSALSNPKPSDGDLAVVRVLSDDGLYDTVEDPYGREVRVYRNDICVCVLGTRKSGTNANGVVPARALKAGETLQLISAAGIVGEAIPASGHGQTPLVDVRIESFLVDANGQQASLRSLSAPMPTAPSSNAIIFVVGGTSAEVGKTTLICRAIRALFESHSVSIGVVKAVGTGRLRDILAYRDAGAATVVDFVSRGWPTTYNMSAETYRSAFRGMIAEASILNQLVFVEVGGDLMTEAAFVVLQEAAALGARGALCANDAMGAVTGLSLFKEAGISVQVVSTFRQNQRAMAQRLGYEAVVDPLDPPAMAGVAAILKSELSSPESW